MRASLLHDIYSVEQFGLYSIDFVVVGQVLHRCDVANKQVELLELHPGTFAKLGLHGLVNLVKVHFPDALWNLKPVGLDQLRQSRHAQGDHQGPKIGSHTWATRSGGQGREYSRITSGCCCVSAGHAFVQQRCEHMPCKVLPLRRWPPHHSAQTQGLRAPCARPS